MEEEHGGEEGVLEELKSDNGKISKGEVVKRIREIKDDKDFAEESIILNAYLNLLEKETEAGRKIRKAKEDLTTKVSKKYPTLSENEVRTLVVDDKWIATLREEIEGEIEKISQDLTQRVKELADRYSTPLPSLEEQVEILNSKVVAHLRKMGFEWK